MPTINYILDHPKPEKQCAIHVRVYWSKGILITRSTGRKIEPKYWSAQKQEAKPNYTGQATFNNSILSLKMRLSKVIEDNPGQPLAFYKKQIDTIYKGDVQEVMVKKGVAGICDIITAYQERKGNTRSPGYIRTFEQTKGHLNDSVGNIPLETFGYKQFEQFTEYLVSAPKARRKKEEDRLNNTINGNIRRIKTVITDAAKRGMRVDPTYSDYEYSPDQTSAIRLNDDEMQKVANVQLELSMEKKVRDAAMVRYYTGIRFSDMEHINRHTIKERGGKYYFDFTMFKNRKVTELLVPEPAMQIIRAYGYRIPKVAMQHHNDLIKQVCKKAGVNSPAEKIRYSGSKRIVTQHEKWELVTTHTFRRSFARKLYDDGIRVEVVSQLLGHSKIETTMLYIGIAQHEGHDAVDKVFNYNQMRVAK